MDPGFRSHPRHTSLTGPLTCARPCALSLCHRPSPHQTPHTLCGPASLCSFLPVSPLVLSQQDPRISLSPLPSGSNSPSPISPSLPAPGSSSPFPAPAVRLSDAANPHVMFTQPQRQKR